MVWDVPQLYQAGTETQTHSTQAYGDTGPGYLQRNSQVRVLSFPCPLSPIAQVGLYRMGASRAEPEMRGESGADEAARAPGKSLEGPPSGHLGGACSVAGDTGGLLKESRPGGFA